MHAELARGRELVGGLRGRDVAAHDRDLQLRHLIPRHVRVVHPRDSPVQVLPQIELDLLLVVHVHETLIRLRVQCPCEGNRAGDDGAVSVVQRGGSVGEGREDGVGADKVGLEAPAGRIGVEVAEEDVDEERLLERVFRDPDVGDPFRVVVWGGGCCCRVGE